jgi:hypothetical protein
MLAHLRKGRTKTTEKGLERMVVKLKGTSSRRKKEIKIGSLKRVLLVVNNRIGFV